MSYLMHVMIEASVIGLLVILLGTIISYFIAIMTDKDTKFLYNPAMFISLFLIGFILHFSFDLIGLNKWYCNNCAGCK